MTAPEKAVVIGASSGALDALSKILPPLPADYPWPIFVVVHIPPDKKSIMAELLQSKCKMRVKEAEDKEEAEAGTVYFAPPDYHLQVEHEKIISLSNDEAILFSRPSIDVLFETAADAYGENLMGIILSGANNDGALGLKAVMDGGGITLVQTPAEAYSYIMPQMALEACSKAEVLTLEEIAIFLQKAASTWS